MIQIDPPDAISCAKEGIIDPDNVQGTGFISNQQVTQSHSIISVVSMVSQNRELTYQVLCFFNTELFIESRTLSGADLLAD